MVKFSVRTEKSVMKDEEHNNTAVALLEEQNMTTVSQHYFSESTQSGDGFTIHIIECMKEEYGMFVWPCSIVLAEYVWQQRLRFSGTTVVELGAGTSLPGLVAAKVGSDVTLTDNANRLEMGLQPGF